MPTIHVPYVNIALDLLSLIVVLIVFIACIGEKMKRYGGSVRFLILVSFVSLALIADMVSWFGEGQPHLRTVTLIGNTVAACMVQIAILCFMEYLAESLYASSQASGFILHVFRILCVVSLVYTVGNAFGEYAYRVNEMGHFVKTENTLMVILYFLFSIMSFVTLILMSLFANHSPLGNRIIFVIYTIFPIGGIMMDHFFHEASLTYTSLAISVLAMYAGIFIRKQAIIDSQEKALMLSQINPHFTYNTLTAIAAMCDSSPQQAQNLTIDFARYLRHNLDTLASKDTIPFEKELEHVECYLKIEKARFRERLNIIYSIHCKDFKLPPLTVQPLVENAVKHGITKKASGGTVKISTFTEGQYNIVEIIDDGVGFDTEAVSSKTAGHVGLTNVESRIRRMCRGTVYIKSTPGVGTRVTILIPRRKGGRS